MLQRLNTSPYQKRRNVTYHFVLTEIFTVKKSQKECHRDRGEGDSVTYFVHTGRD